MPDPRQIPATTRPRSDAEALRRLVERQHGVVSRRQLEAHQVAGSAITRWIRAGRLHRIHPHVYAVGHTSLTVNGRLIAALLYGGDEALLSHTTAGWVWSLLEAEQRWIHLVARDHRRSLPGVRVHRARRLDRAECRGFRVTSVARTLLDVAAILPFRQLRRALAEADYRGILVAEDVREVLGRGRPGSRALRAALERHMPQLASTFSELEHRFLEICEAAELPLPEVNARVSRMRVDAVWRAQRVAVELDGGPAHSGAAAMKRDRERELLLRAHGFTVVRYSWHQVTKRSQEVLCDLRRLLSA
jgi:hypothetical protein